MDPTLTLVSVVGSGTGTGQGITPATNVIGSNQIVPVLLADYIPQPNSADNLYLLRDMGVSTTGTEVVVSALIAANAANYFFSTTNSANGPYLQNNPSVTDIGNYTTAHPWPAPDNGYISTAFPSVAMTLELRFDLKEPPINLASDFSTEAVNAGVASTGTITSGFTYAAVGTNLLQSLTNLDLTGDGYHPVPGNGNRSSSWTTPWQ
jgi:hypothetical protein